MMVCTRKKRPRLSSNSSTMQSSNDTRSSGNNNKRMKNINRSCTFFSSAAVVLAWASLVVGIDMIKVVAFTTSSLASSSTTGGGSVVIDSNSDVLLSTTSESTSKKRRRVSVSSTQLDFNDSTATATATLDGHGVSITMASPSSHELQRGSSRSGTVSATRTSTATKTATVVDLDDTFYQISHNNIDYFPSIGVTSASTTRLLSTTTAAVATTDSNKKSNRKSKMVRSKSRNSSPRKKLPKTSGDVTNNHDDGISSRSSSSSKKASLSLTREEERQITCTIQDLHKALNIRDELIRENEEWPVSSPSSPSIYDHKDKKGSNDNADDEFPTEEDWAKACGLNIASLRQIMSKGQEARAVLVSANVGLVTSIAKRHHYALKQATVAGGGVGTILTLQDMIQEGNIGLMKATQRFEPERGWRFSTYATYWIRQRILQSISDSSRVIRLPVHITNTLQKLNKARKDMTAEIGRIPSDPELAHYMKISVDKLRKVNDKTRSVVSLESPLRSGGNHKAEIDRRTIGDFIASDAPTPEEDAQRKLLQRDIRAVINELGERERDVLILRFGLDNGESMSISQTAAQLGITIDQVRYVEARALNKLRNPQRNFRLKDYLDDGHHSMTEKKKVAVSISPLWSSPSITTKAKNESRHHHHHHHRCPNDDEKHQTVAEKFWFF